MKYILFILFSSSALLQLSAQQTYLLDSSVVSTFFTSSPGSITNNKYLYDSQNRIVSKESENYLTNYEYKSELQLKRLETKDGSFSRTEKRHLSPKGTVHRHEGYWQQHLGAPIRSYDSIYQIDIFENVISGEIYDYVTGFRALSTSFERKYNSFQFITENTTTSYNRDTQEPRFTERIVYTYNPDHQLQSLVSTITAPNGMINLSDSTHYAYDQQGRILWKELFSLGFQSTERTDYKYFDAFSIETWTYGNGPYLETIHYYATNPISPFDSIATYEIFEENRRLKEFESYMDVSEDNPSHTITLLYRRGLFGDSGQVVSFRQEKNFYIEELEVPTEEMQPIEFELVPNPMIVNSYFNVVTNTADFDKIELFDMQGRLINSQLANGTSVNTFLTPANSGTYFIKLLKANRAVSSIKKFVVF